MGVYFRGCLTFCGDKLGVFTMSTRRRTSPLFCSVIRRKAALVFPTNIRLAKERASCLVSLEGGHLGRRCWIVLPSNTRSFRFPSLQRDNLLSRQAMSSFDLEERKGFWRARMVKTVTVLKATDSREDCSAKALNKLASSETKSLPAFPKGTLKLFFLLWTVSA